LYQAEVATWIRVEIWQVLPELRSLTPTILAFDRGNPDLLVGFGTWCHVEALSATGEAEKQIEIAWFGVDSRYQGVATATGERCANRLFATVLADALAAEDSTDDMPVTLLCHVDNQRGRRFWMGQGFEDAADAEQRPPGGQAQRYQRMVLGAGTVAESTP